LKESSLFLIILFASLIIFVPPNVGAHDGGVSKARWAQPVIDGTVGAAEWPDESKYASEVRTSPNGYRLPVTMYSANDDEYLYLAFVVAKGKEFSVNPNYFNIYRIYIDLGHDGTMNLFSDLEISDQGTDTGTLNPHFRMTGYQSTELPDSKPSFLRGYGWKDDSLMYEIRIPMELKGSQIFSKESTIGLGLLLETAIIQPTNYKYEQLTFPPNAMTWKFHHITNHSSELVPLPNNFVDVLLSDSKSEDNIPASSEDTDSAETENTPQSNTELQSIAIAIGIAVAGIAIAIALVMTRRKGVPVTSNT
jgi:hypothetical protein